MKRLNIGCGRCYLPPEEGWTNLDIFSTVKAETYADMMRLPFDRDTFDLAYSAHCLEHQHRHLVAATLVHWKSVIKPGGTLRLAVPDFRAICEHYMEYHNLPLLMGLLYGAQDFHLNRHTVAFDEFYLKELLEKCGFVNVRRWDWRTTDHAAYDDYSRAMLPHLDFEKGKLMSLNMEATRPE